jgi:hypothetical protein
MYHIYFSIIWRNSRCNQYGVGVVVDVYMYNHVDGYMGLPCTDCMYNILRVS